ncbi:MAG: DUF72 domain-containing protein [Armatimonadetes bacterium]|nr:DUF72 domain-containing protein [Armatimonadota bacterium]
MRSPWQEELPEHLLVGTSSFSSDDWDGVFYPTGLPPGERLGFYAAQFPTVEVDATFYRMPSRSQCETWARRTPDSFRFCLKAPQEITHEAGLTGADALIAELLDVTAAMGEKRAGLLLQFPYVAKGKDATEYEHGDRFRKALEAWLERWAGSGPWAVEIRNSTWLRPGLLALLRHHGVPLALTAYYTMPSLARMQHQGLDPVTGPFAYVRFLGDRRRIDEKIDGLIAAGRKEARFNEIVEDREDEMRSWVEALLAVLTRVPVRVYFNNHYAGFGPASARRFAELWREIHGRTDG